MNTRRPYPSIKRKLQSVGIMFHMAIYNGVYNIAATNDARHPYSLDVLYQLPRLTQSEQTDIFFSLDMTCLIK